MSEVQVVIRIIISAILGGLIGFEREIYKHEAGLRTHILVAVGSTLIMLTSQFVFDIYKGIYAVDPSRMAANVVTGIGFIGAGTIIRYGMAVRGLTTAASLWITAAVGLAIGCGFYIAGVFATIVAISVLFFLRALEKRISGRKIK